MTTAEVDLEELGRLYEALFPDPMEMDGPALEADGTVIRSDGMVIANIGRDIDLYEEASAADYAALMVAAVNALPVLIKLARRAFGE